jgi:hypothetical protein
MTGIELHIAAAAVAEVYLRLVLYRHDPSVLKNGNMNNNSNK